VEGEKRVQADRLDALIRSRGVDGRPGKRADMRSTKWSRPEVRSSMEELGRSLRITTAVERNLKRNR
jgi:hypothetical protein